MIDNWHALINKPILQALVKMFELFLKFDLKKLIVICGPITPEGYLIPESSITNMKKVWHILTKKAIL